MPVYEYVCSACRHRTDILHGIHDTGPTFCPECGAEGTVRKGIVVPSIVFKGSGWAKKDRASSARARSTSKDDGGTGATDTAAPTSDSSDSPPPPPPSSSAPATPSGTTE